MKQIGRKTKTSSENNTEGGNLTDKVCSKISISRQIEYQQQRLIDNKNTIKDLQEKIEQLTKITKQKRQRIDLIEKDIKEVEEKKLKLPFMKQLREHFKKLKQELGAAFIYQVQQDDVDVDQMTYQQLLELGDKIGKVSKGLGKKELEELQRINYQRQDKEQQSCTICREQYIIGQQCLKLNCSHIFHSDCAKPWLQIQKTCPLCKSQIIK